jgi:hypothetical protein
MIQWRGKTPSKKQSLTLASNLAEALVGGPVNAVENRGMAGKSVRFWISGEHAH